MHALRILLAVSSLPLVATASPQVRSKTASAAHFQRVSDSGLQGIVTVGFDADDYADLSERHGRGQAFTLSQLPLPGQLSADLELRPCSAMPEGARAQIVGADGRLSFREPSVRCFAGYVVGGGSSFIAVSESALNGYLYSGGELYYLATEPGAKGRATLAHASQMGTLDMGACGFVDELMPSGGGGVERAIVGPSLRVADVFIEADNEYRSRFLSDQECIDYTTLLLTAASEIYRRDLGVRLQIPDRYLRVWNTTPPWGRISGYNHLRNVYAWWQSAQNPQRYLPRAAVHVLTSPIFGGTSRGVDGLCNNVRAYEISSLGGRFPYPRAHTDRYNWDLFVVAHEFGHTFGSPHSALYSPPIGCEDGSGPDSGTIMSYCHLDHGIARVGMRFHPREQQRIRAVVNTGCLTTQLLTPGDYDGDGNLDGQDLSAMKEVLFQGFRSTAAEEVFDLDGNGLLNDLDHDLLARTVYAAPPAQIYLRNGAGINPSCLETTGNPVLGTTWYARIRAPGVGSSTLLVGYDLPLDGLTTSRGELLVKTLPYGGTKLFTSPGVSDGTYSEHAIELPLDPALFGRHISFQALIVDGPKGDRYCNALDAILSPYE